MIVWNLITLDGFFEGAEAWDLGFHEAVWGEELERFSLEQAAEADLLVFGRRTYEGMAAHWPSATGKIADVMNGIDKVVCSRTLERADWNNTSVVRDAEREIAALKRRPGRSMLIFGSAELSHSLMAAGLIDEWRLGVAPVVLGEGRPLFGPGAKPTKLWFEGARELGRGCVLVRYRPG